MNTKITLYLASPWFSPEQAEREERIKNHLRLLGFDVFSPKDNVALPATASKEDQESVFRQNLAGINDVDAVFAITNTKDMGTLFECGYAYGIGKPIVYFAEGLNGQFNLMLARSGMLVYTKMEDISYEEVKKALLTGEVVEYEGEIE